MIVASDDRVEQSNEPAETVSSSGLQTGSRLSARALQHLHDLVGCESSLEETLKAVSLTVRELYPSTVGAHLVTCSDESEKECREAFTRLFAQRFLPRLKFAVHSPFTSANLGGRYEWGSVRIAENHFAIPAGSDRYKLMVVKINSHVAVAKSLDCTTYGCMHRYRQESFFCGALRTLLDGGRGPFLDELAATFASEGRDRLGALRNPDLVAPELRCLCAAIVNARLQARSAIIDIQDHTPQTPTVYLTLPCVTLNRGDRDTEILCGVYYADLRSSPGQVDYFGLGCEPEAYSVTLRMGRLKVEDAQSRTVRPARDHREMLVTELKKAEAPIPQHDTIRDTVQEIRRKYELHQHDLGPLGGVLLKTLLAALVEISPVPAVLLLFGEGIFEIHHVFRMHKMAQQVERDETAKSLLSSIIDKIESLEPERARRVLEVLLRHYT
jgi:hypothetical protein